MNAREALHQALGTALWNDNAVSGAVTMIHEALPDRAARPYVLVEEPVLTDWSTKDIPGREGQVSIVTAVSGERPGRLRLLVGAVEDAVVEMPGELGGGWRTTSLVLTRSRLLREGPDRWIGRSDFRVRMLRV